MTGRLDTAAAHPLAPVRGRVRSLHRKPETPAEHGLPKPSVPEVQLTRQGVAGDFNRYRHEEQNDEPAQAVLLMPIETIRTLNAEGWPVAEGDLGENVTTEGIPYGEFRPGDRFRVGDAILRVTKPCTPCTNLELLPYVQAAGGARFLKTMVDRRGWYAAVVREGRVRTGDPIERP
jgi:MOSC domain-containing protein YiiM